MQDEEAQVGRELGAFSYHEAIDRADTVNSILNDVLLQHEVLQLPESKSMAEKLIKAQELIAEVYHELSAVWDSKFS